ncbi:MAG: DUF4304 domain-containing protein [Chloroflexi bacterium]|nr:DUF4304 domain-containing protein [Chloroflexota bacterium]
MSENNPRGEIVRQAHEALQRLRGLDPSEPPPEPVAEAAWLLETDGGRRHPLDVVASGSLHPALAKLGFKRQGRAWNRGSGGLVHVINLHGSKYNVLTQLSPVLFYVNIGVFIPEVHELVWAEPSPAFVREAYCQIRQRLNTLAREPKRLIMAPEPTRTLEQQGEQLTREILEYGVSFLDRLSSLDAVDQELTDMLSQRAYRGDVFARRMSQRWSAIMHVPCGCCWSCIRALARTGCGRAASIDWRRGLGSSCPRRSRLTSRPLRTRGGRGTGSHRFRTWKLVGCADHPRTPRPAPGT